MNNEFTMEVNGLTNCEYFSDIDDIISGSKDCNAYQVIVTPFDDLRESFDRIIAQNVNAICLNQVGLIDVVPMFEDIMSNRYNKLEIVFVTYKNFEIARRNTVNFNPILERIDHINSFMISRKFEQFRHSVAAVMEFFFFPEMFFHVYNRNIGDRKEQYVRKVKESLTIKIVNLVMEGNDESS